MGGGIHNNVDTSYSLLACMFVVSKCVERFIPNQQRNANRHTQRFL